MNEPPENPDIGELAIGLPRRYTTDQVSGAAGVPTYRARRFWRALGFANVPQGDVEFTEADVAALKTLLGLVDEGILDEEQSLLLARALGRASARLATSHAEALVRALDAKGASGSGRSADARRMVDRILPDAEALLLYSWRRHLTAAFQRLQIDVGMTQQQSATVGFADLVDFTGLSRRLTDEDLVGLVNRFEGRIGDLVTGFGGRVVKSMGDEVLFVTDEPDVAANIAIEIAELISRRPLPGVRVGLEVGNVVMHAGDVFGDTVNLASRLTALSEPNRVLVGPALATRLARHPAYQLTLLEPINVRGFGSLAPSVLRRRPPATDPNPPAATPA